MKKQNIILLLFAAFCLSFPSYAQLVIDNPIIASTNARNVVITKVELLSDATVLHITASNPPNRWVRFSSQTVLKDSKSSRTYRLLKCDGYPLDTEHYMSTGSQDFKMYFEPLASDVMKVDFIEGYDLGAFRILGIVINNTIIVLENPKPSINISASPGEQIIIPAKTLRKLKKNQDLIINITK